MKEFFKEYFEGKYGKGNVQIRKLSYSKEDKRILIDLKNKLHKGTELAFFKEVGWWE